MSIPSEMMTLALFFFLLIAIILYGDEDVEALILCSVCLLLGIAGRFWITE